MWLLSSLMILATTWKTPKCQKPAHFLSVQMAVLNSFFFSVYSTLDMYNFEWILQGLLSKTLKEIEQCTENFFIKNVLQILLKQKWKESWYQDRKQKWKKNISNLLRDLSSTYYVSKEMGRWGQKMKVLLIYSTMYADVGVWA